MSTTDIHEPAPSSSLGIPEVLEVEAGVFKDTCLHLLDQVNEGAFEVVVTKNGTPVARVVSEGGNAPSAHGFMSGTVLEQGDIVAPDFEKAWGDLA
jgi:antitoxin (DNA-binding transcriptional repressor) of toxin-antitoxin stability system